jgi:hypothetical protein
MQVARRPSHQASGKTEPPSAALLVWANRRSLSRRKLLLLQFDAPLSCGAGNIFYARRRLGNAIISARPASNFICARGHVGRLY